MKTVGIVVLFVAVFAFSSVTAEDCSENICKRPSCQCANRTAPISGKIPQLVSLSIDDSAVKLSFDDFIVPVLYPRMNPDKCPISATMFVPHEYTDYSVVNDMFNHGFEIGSHSITKNYSTEYWGHADAKLIEAEMGGQRDVIAHFANIKKDYIIASRIPHFQLNGDETYKGLKNAGFELDSSWPTRYTQGKNVFPYTLDYSIHEPCQIGTCPQSPVKGFWITPITDWKSQDGIDCNKLLGCDVKGSAKEMFEWMKKNFLESYNGNRAPFTVLINYGLFNYYPNSKEALIQFFDYLGTLKDVFLVSEKQVVDWMKNPVEASKFSSCTPKRTEASCDPRSCKLNTNTNDIRYMVSCVDCPNHYPWLNDPYGNQ